MEIQIVHNSQTPIYMQIKNQIKEMVLTGEVLDGFMLPSERMMAKSIGVHRNTIIKAYNELKADGLISAQQGLGYKIVYRSQDSAFPEKAGNIPWLHLLKEEFVELEDTFDTLFSKTYSEKCISFAGGIVPAEAYNKESIKIILNEMLISDKEEIYSYAPYQGNLRLRQNLAVLLREKGITVQASEIQILSETNQALDYLIELLIRPGDHVITEEPLSPDIYRELAMAGAKVLTVPMDEDGMIVSHLEPLIQKYTPKFIYVSSSFNDPTGIVMSTERRLALLELSHKYRIPIVEEDSASGLRYEEKLIPSLKSLDKRNHVIYIYSFALTFAPGVRLAFVVAPKMIVKRLSYLVSTHLISIDSLSQRLMSIYLEKGMYQSNLRMLCGFYKAKRDLMCAKLEEARIYGVTYTKPKGGIYIWCRLPNTINAKMLLQKCYKKGVAFIPGSVFFPYGTKGENFIRLNYSYPNEEQIREGMALLIEAMGESIR